MLVEPSVDRQTTGPGNLSNPLTVAVPFYRNEHLVEPLVSSLIDCADDLAQLKAEVIFYNDSPDYAPLGHALEGALRRAEMAFSCRLICNETNLGFVGTMNVAMADALERHRDVILLNSDTLVFPGSLPEMARVACLDPMIGFVSPRSNNATLATLPHQERFRSADPQTAWEAAKAIAAYLPDLSYVPTAVGFCLLIRWNILAEFGLFDEIYGHGYNEENDLIMRAGQCGYRAVLANKAFVWHQLGQSFAATAAAREEKNRQILINRYPEYENLTATYFESPEYRAEFLLGTLLPDETGRLDLAFDFSTFRAYHNGTYKLGEQILRAAAKYWQDEFNLYVICSEEVYCFHKYATLGIERRDPNDTRPFAVIFRVGQPFYWSTIERLVAKAACFGLYMLDTIAVDCSQLYLRREFNLWQFSLDHADLIVALSELTAEQLERRFRLNPSTVWMRMLPSLDLRDYELQVSDPEASLPKSVSPGYIFVVGNHFAHKFVIPTVDAVAQAYPERSIVALGTQGTSQSPQTAPLNRINATFVDSGALGEAEISALYRGCSVVIFPSHYEGFGLPVLEALAARKPTFVRRSKVTEEMRRGLASASNLYTYETTTELIAQLRRLPSWIEPGPAPRRLHCSHEVAAQLRKGIERALANTSYSMLVKRARAVQMANDLVRDPFSLGSYSIPARLVGHITESLAARIFEHPVMFNGARLIFRTARFAKRGLRALSQRSIGRTD